MSKTIIPFYLQIGGFNLKISFQEKFKDQVHAHNARQAIRKIYNGFVLKHEPAQTDYELQLLDDSQTVALKRGKQVFLLLYKKLSQRKMTAYSQLGWIHLSIILRAILGELLFNKGIIIHASAVNYHKKALVFVGPTNAGKSTAADLLSSKYPKLADDSVIIRRQSGQYYLYQTPFVETDTQLNRSRTKIQLGRIVLLTKSTKYVVTKAPINEQGLNLLINQLLLEKTSIRQDTKFLFELISAFPLYRLKFGMDSKRFQQVLYTLAKFN